MPIQSRRALMLASLLTLGACASGGGGGGSSPPAAPLPPPPPPPPPPPVQVGEALSGGQIFDDGSYQGLFGGPVVTAAYSANSVFPNMQRRGVNPDGTPSSTSLTFDNGNINVSGGSSFPTVLETTERSYFGGSVVERDKVLTFQNGATRTLTEIDLRPGNTDSPDLIRQFVYSARDENGDLTVEAFMTLGSDTPLAPGASVAVYSATTYGSYFNVVTGAADKFKGEGTFKFDMASGDWSGTITDVDFVGAAPGADPNLVSETASDGRDFGLEFTGRLGSGNQFSGFVEANGVGLSGPVAGSFYGEENGAADKMGGQFYMYENVIASGPIAYLQGGFVGDYVPMTPGVSTAGGQIGDEGIVGDFRGPIAGFVPADQSAPYDGSSLIAGTTRNSAADPDVLVSLSPRTTFGQQQTVDITVGSNQLAFDLDDAEAYQFRSPDREGYVTELFASNVDTANDAGSGFSIYNFNLGNPPGQEAGLKRAQYARLIAFDQYRPSDSRLNTFLFMTIGADLVEMPTTGTATFDTGLLGYFGGPGGVSPFTSRGDLVADFGVLTVQGQFDTVQFSDDGGRFNTPPGVTPFGLSLDATILGDDFRGTMTAIGADMDGAVFGDFYGAEGAAPTEIGGAFAISGSDGDALGGFVGVAE